MKKLLELLGKAKKYLGIVLGYLKKLLTWGEKAEEVLDNVEDRLEKEAEKKEGGDQ